MCRYGFKNYKLTYGCFTCQVGFKRRIFGDVQPEVFIALQKKAKIEGSSMRENIQEAKCPNCGNEMANLGRDLRLPAKSKEEQWKCIKYLYDNNYNIYSCGCSGIGFVPHKIKDAIELVENYKNQLVSFAKQQKLQEKQFALDKKRKEKGNVLKTKMKLRAIKKEK